MSKNKKITKAATLLVLSSATLLSGVVAVENPLQAEASSNAKDLVVKAEKLAGTLKWEVSYEHRKIAYPKNVFEQPDMKLFNQTKKAFNDAKAALKGVKGKEKLVLEARLDHNVKVYFDRAVKYIDAVSAGKKILETSKNLENKISTNIIDSSTETAFRELSSEINKKSPILQRVYGISTRSALINFYQENAKKTLGAAVYPISIKNEIDLFTKTVGSQDVDQSIYHAGRLEKLFLEGRQKGLLKVNTKLYKNLENQFKAVKDKYENFVTVYNANSTDVTKPTMVGGTSQASQKYNHTIVIVAGKGQFIKLSNAEVNGNIIIKGDQSGAGTVYLENVKVNKVENKGGSIIVNDVADHSLYQSNVTASELLVNDTNGAHIVADLGTKIGAVIVSETAGISGGVVLDSLEKGTFGKIELASNRSEKSEGVTLNGDFTETSVSVTGEGTTLKIAKDAKVKEINIKTKSTLDAEAGANVQDVTLEAKEKGQLIDLKGDLKNTVVTIQNANATIKVEKDTEIKEVKKDSSVSGTVEIENGGKIAMSTDVVVTKNPPLQIVSPITTDGSLTVWSSNDDETFTDGQTTYQPGSILQYNVNLKSGVTLGEFSSASVDFYVGDTKVGTNTVKSDALKTNATATGLSGLITAGPNAEDVTSDPFWNVGAYTSNQKPTKAVFKMVKDGVEYTESVNFTPSTVQIPGLLTDPTLTVWSSNATDPYTDGTITYQPGSILQYNVNLKSGFTLGEFSSAAVDFYVGDTKVGTNTVKSDALKSNATATGLSGLITAGPNAEDVTSDPFWNVGEYTSNQKPTKAVFRMVKDGIEYTLETALSTN